MIQKCKKCWEIEKSVKSYAPKKKCSFLRLKVKLARFQLLCTKTLFEQVFLYQRVVQVSLFFSTCFLYCWGFVLRPCNIFSMVSYIFWSSRPVPPYPPVGWGFPFGASATSCLVNFNVKQFESRGTFDHWPHGLRYCNHAETPISKIAGLSRGHKDWRLEQVFRTRTLTVLAWHRRHRLNHL